MTVLDLPGMSSMLRRGALSFLLASGVVLAAGACQKPQPPQLTPKEARITAVDLSGFDMRVKLDAFNPNGFELSVRSVVAHVVVDGTRDLGTVTAPLPFNLPANARTTIDAPLSVKWKSAADLATLATSKRAIPYVVDGTASIGGSSLSVDVPFKLEGTITPQQLQQAGLKSLQNLLPK